MGKKIDAFVLSVLIAGGLYLYFDHTIQNNAASFALAGLCFWLLRRMFVRVNGRLRNSRWISRRKMRRETGSTIMRLACDELQDVHAAVSSLLRKAYGQDYPLEIVQLHPSDAIGAEKVFELWKKHRGEERLVICATCKCSPDVRMLCEGLKRPKIAVADASLLSRLISEYPEGIFIKEAPSARKKLQLKRLAMLLINRKNAPRCLVFSLSMLMLYLFSGSIAYLISSMVLLFISLSALHRSSQPVKLF